MGKRQEGAEVIQIAALIEDHLEQITDLTSTAAEVLFVMADTLGEEEIGALRAWKERMEWVGKRPFLIRTCHRQGEVWGPKPLFDMTVVCGRDKDLSLSLPAETVASILQGTIPVERQELLRPGRLVSFEHRVTWKGDSKQKIDRLCHTLRQETAAAHMENRPPSRLLGCITVTAETPLETVLQCADALTGEGSPSWCNLFQIELTDRVSSNFIIVRGMVGG